MKSHSVWAQSPLPTKIVAGVVVVVGFALLFFVESIYGNKSGLLNSMIWALVPAILFAVSILFLFVVFKSRRQEQSVWYKQPILFQGIGFVFLAVGLLILALTFTMVGTANLTLPPLLIFFLDCMYLFWGILAIIQSLLVSQGKHKNIAPPLEPL